MAEKIPIRDLVVRTLALACRVDERTIAPETRMAELDVDSLTLLAIVARVEALQEVEFTGEETLALFEARDVGGLIAALERLLRERRGGA